MYPALVLLKTPVLQAYLKTKEPKKSKGAGGKTNKQGIIVSLVNSTRILPRHKILSVPAYFPQTPPPPLPH